MGEDQEKRFFSETKSSFMPAEHLGINPDTLHINFMPEKPD